ncbi:MAG: NfeD family protein [Bacteroidales bacterium]|jgi:membrane-bound ClpP family serine protease|nr:NfeD family protein [Bacteroidales bacterium]
MNWLVIIFLILIGVVALLLELFALPGAIVGIIGSLFIIAGIVLSYIQYGAVAGNLTLLGTGLLIIVAVVLFLRSKTWKKMTLTTQIDGKMNIQPDSLQVGMEGVSLSRLAPSGKAIINNEMVEVFSSLDFIDQNMPIVITKIEGSKIIVKLK